MLKIKSTLTTKPINFVKETKAMNNYKIGIIGAGNVAHHLVAVFDSLGFEISWVWNRNVENAIVLADSVNAQVVTDLCDLDVNNTIVFVAISDDAILPVIQTRNWKGSYVVHTSGSFNSSQLEPFCDFYGAFYPFQTLRKELEVDWEKIPIFLEANDQELLTNLVEIAEICSDTISYKTSEERKKLHLAGVITNNFVYYLMRSVRMYCENEGLQFEEVFPLFEQTAMLTFNNELDLQTGPAKRGDENTLHKHLQMLDKTPELKKLYTQLSQAIYQNYHGKKLEL